MHSAEQLPTDEQAFNDTLRQQAARGRIRVAPAPDPFGRLISLQAADRSRVQRRRRKIAERLFGGRAA
ncbi:MAG TPA: hypothetical protein VGM91_22740 [Conexibacter sp.]|jgi:hypothetical protein